MAGKRLTKMPLLEAILELRWGAQPLAGRHAQMADPSYPLLVGRFQKEIENSYPAYEPVSPAVSVGSTSGSPMHRFRVREASWPLIQLGVGILSLNATPPTYSFQDEFRPRAREMIAAFNNAHPAIDTVKLTSVLMRYIDRIPFDKAAGELTQFIEKKLKISVRLPEGLFAGTSVGPAPLGFTFNWNFWCESPRGMVTILFSSGEQDNQPIILWETRFHSAGGDVPAISAMTEWLDKAHDIIVDKLFWRFIEGDLEREFS